MELQKVSSLNILEFLRNFVSDNTRKAYEKDLNDFFEFCTSRGRIFSSPNEILSIDVIAYRDYLYSASSDKTVCRKLASLRSFLKWLHTNGFVSNNVAQNVKLRKVSVKNPTQVLTDEEVSKLLEAPKDLEHKLALHLLFYLGLRRAELLNLKFSDIYKNSDIFVIKVMGKGNKQRELPLNSKLVELINSYKDLKIEKDLMFEMNPSTLFRLVKKYAKTCNINKRISPHSCRATLITKILEEGTPITEVAELVGHSDVNTTQIYWKRRNNLKNSVINKILW